MPAPKLVIFDCEGLAQTGGILFDDRREPAGLVPIPHASWHPAVSRVGLRAKSRA